MSVTLLPCTAEHVEWAIRHRTPRQQNYDHFTLYQNNISYQISNYFVFISNPCGWNLVDQLIATVPEHIRVFYWNGLRVPEHIRTAHLS